ncbi:hypothetical protein ACH5RR_009558 [Cinchona calisaya]|uniref:FAR1 domain-containing protein n=1 Tax=Cinchona calisaya TaxID=153742 RepID=A0ABD3AEJ1_9GENT
MTQKVNDEPVIEKSLSLHEINVPEVQMMFSSEKVRKFYNSYAQHIGFSIAKISTKNGVDGTQKYFSLGCSKNDKTASTSKYSFYPRPSTKTNCNAKINVAIQYDGMLVITRVYLDHNHNLNPEKSRHFRCNKVLDSCTKRKLVLNDEASISLSKCFYSCVVEAGGYENLSFDVSKCSNYALEAQRLRLGVGDFEALTQKTTLKQFVEQYDNALKSKIEKENKGEESTFVFEVVETILGKDGAPWKDVTFVILYTEEQCKVECLYRLFDFRGIKRGYQGITNIYDDSSNDEIRRRRNNLNPLLLEVQELGVESDERYSLLLECLKDTKEKLMAFHIANEKLGSEEKQLAPSHWIQTLPGCLKFNFDAIVFSDLSSCGLGMVVRNHKDVSIAGVMEKIFGVIGPVIGEMLATKRAMEIGVELSLVASNCKAMQCQ